MSISRHRLYRAGEPLGDSATRTEGCRLIVGGGGSGGGGSTWYGGLEELYQEQAESARLLRSQAEQNLPGAVSSYMNEVNAVADPGYADQQSKLAAADMASANAMERSATNRELQSMGVNPNDARFVGANRATEVNNAARMAAGKNIARNDANRYQLAVAQDAVGTFTGQSNSAASQAAGASSGLQSLYSQQDAQKQQAAAQQSQNTANAVGGAMALYSMFKDGGKVKKPSAGYGLKRVERHMLGGTAGSQQKTQQGFFQMPTTPPPPQRPAQPVQQGPNMSQMINAGKKSKSAADGTAASQHTDKIGRIAGKFSSDAGNQIQSQAAGMRMGPGEARSAADAYREAASNAANPADKQSYLNAASNIEQGAGINSGADFTATNAATAEANGVNAMTSAGTEAAAGQAAGAAAEGLAVEGAGATLAEASGGALTNLVTDSVASSALSGSITGGAGLGTAGATTGAVAGSTGLGAAGAALGAAMPWVGAAMAVGSLLELWADGGKVGTQAKEPASDAEAHAMFSQAFNNGNVNDLREGGKVPGEWTENKDTVPALLVEEEFVLPAEAAALVGERDLEKLRGYGLKLRARGETPSTIRPVGFSRASALAGSRQ